MHIGVQPIDAVIALAQARPAAYVVSSEDLDYLYKGSARILPERLKDHRAGRVSRTKGIGPLVVVYFEHFDTYADAQAREKYLKTGAGREWLKRRLPSSP